MLRLSSSGLKSRLNSAEVWLDRPAAIRILLAIGGLGLASRFVLARVSIGSEDIITWSRFASQIDVHGVEWMYRNVSEFNHPPLMGWWALAAARLSSFTGWAFEPCFKLLPCVADICSAVLLWRIWRARAGVGYGALAFALFALNPVSLLVSGYHGNTDSALAMLALASCYLLECRNAPFTAGLALGGAINVKLIPVLLIPILVVRVTKWDGLVRLAAGLSVAVIPFVPALLTSWPGFRHNALEYNSSWENWGFAFFIRHAEASSRLHAIADIVHRVFASIGRYLIVGGILAVCQLQRLTRRFDSFQLAACAFALFLVFTPGFGVQYTVVVVPALFACSLSWAVVYSLTAGAFIFGVYFLFWNVTWPLYSHFTLGFSQPVSLLGILSWALLGTFLVHQIRGGFRVSQGVK